MKYILVDTATGKEIVFLKTGRTGFPSPNNPARLYDSREAAESHAVLLRSVLGGIWEVQQAISVVEENLVAA